MTAGAILSQDKEARQHGRILYRVSVDGRDVGSVARWEGDSHWTINAAWLPSTGHDETAAEAGRIRQTRKAALEDLVQMARDFGPLSTTMTAGAKDHPLRGGRTVAPVASTRAALGTRSAGEWVDLPQRVLADLLGVTARTVKRWERRDRDSVEGADPLVRWALAGLVAVLVDGYRPPVAGLPGVKSGDHCPEGAPLAEWLTDLAGARRNG